MADIPQKWIDLAAVLPKHIINDPQNNTVYFFTDGSYFARQGGWGVVGLEKTGDSFTQLVKDSSHCPNIRSSLQMELRALNRSLEFTRLNYFSRRPVCICLDDKGLCKNVSAYLLGCVTSDETAKQAIRERHRDCREAKEYTRLFDLLDEAAHQRLSANDPRSEPFPLQIHWLPRQHNRIAHNTARVARL